MLIINDRGEKIILLSILALVIFLGFGIAAKVFSNYVLIEGKFEAVNYPEGGFVQNADQAVALCCNYMNNLCFQGEDEFLPEQLQAKYDDRLKAWIITDKNSGSEEPTLDGFKMAIRKKDGKILMHSMT